MPDSTVNIPLLRAAVEFAEKSAELTGDTLDLTEAEDNGDVDFAAALAPAGDTAWYQTVWSKPIRDPERLRAELGRVPTVKECGTAYCIAGYVASQHPDYTVTIDESDSGYRGVSDLYLEERIAGEPFRPGQVARDMLGITQFQADQLFEANNSITDVRTIAEDIAGTTL